MLGAVPYSWFDSGHLFHSGPSVIVGCSGLKEASHGFSATERMLVPGPGVNRTEEMLLQPSASFGVITRSGPSWQSGMNI